MIPLLRIAVRNVLRNRRRSLLEFFALFFALFVMVAVRGFLNGFQGTIRESVIFGQTGALQIHRKGFIQSESIAPLHLDLPTDETFLAKVTSVPGVSAVTPRIVFPAMANANDTTAFALFSAIDPKRELAVCPRRSEMISAGKTLVESSRDSAILTPALATNLGIQLGGKAVVLANDRDGVLNALELEYIGAYGQEGMPLPEQKIGFLPLAFAQELLRMPDRATELAVAVTNLGEVEKTRDLLQAALGADYEVATWREIASYVDAIAQTQNGVLNLISAIFMVVALLGVVNAMLMSVFERTREIGTMMSLGVRRRQILALFLLEAALIGASGGTLGILAGLGFVLYFEKTGITIHWSSMPAPLHIYPSVSAGFVVLMFVFAATGAALAALWPSLRASRMRPVEALAAV